MSSPRVALITGASGGLGLQVAKDLAAKSYSLLLVGRGPKLQKAREECASSLSTTTNASVSAIECDFRSLDQVKRAAADALAQSSAIDLVLLNAATWPSSSSAPAPAPAPATTTTSAATATATATASASSAAASPVDETLLVNHLSQFLLARLLLPALRRSERGGRCVFVSSELHRSTSPLAPTPGAIFEASRAFAARTARPADYPPRAAYAASKLLNVMSAREMQRREPAGSRVRFAAASPGFVPSTGLARNAAGSGAAAWLFRTLAPLLPFAVSLQEGARRLEAALEASDEEGSGGGGGGGGGGGAARYYVKGLPAEPSAAALDERAGAEMWRLTAEALGGAGERVK